MKLHPGPSDTGVVQIATGMATNALDAVSGGNGPSGIAGCCSHESCALLHGKGGDRMLTALKKWTEELTDKNKMATESFFLPESIGLMEVAVGIPVVSNSRIVGSGVSAAMNTDAAYAAARQSGDMDAALQHLSVSPATGCAMILSLAQSASGYNPASPDASTDTDGFNRYLTSVLSCPVIQTELNDHLSLDWKDDWHSVVDRIAAYYVGLDAQDVDVIRNGLWTIARAAASSPNTNEAENLFVQSALNLNGSVKIYLYRSSVTMKQDVHRGSGKNAPTVSSDQTHFSLYRTVLDFDSQNWPAYAEFILPRTDASLNSWLADNTTPEGTVPVNWTC